MRDPYIVRRKRSSLETGYLKRIAELESKNEILTSDLSRSIAENKELSDKLDNWIKCAEVRLANWRFYQKATEDKDKKIEKMKKYTKCEGCIHQEEHLNAIINGKQGSAICMLECNASHSCFELKELAEK